MKKVFFGVIAFLFIAVAASAQVKDAQKAFNQYNLDPSNNKGNLKVAQEAIDKAISSGEADAEPVKVWSLKGDIYNEIATQLVTVRQLGFGDASELPQVENAALEAYEAYKMALSKAAKKFEIKDAVKGLQAAQGNLSNLGIFKYEEQKYEGAFKSFQAGLEAHDLIKKQGEKSSLDVVDDYNNQVYITGLAALQGNMIKEAKPYFMKLYEMKYDKPTVYEAMYKIEAEEKSPEAAYHFLEAGREKYPDDVSLLFADINHALRTNQLEKLITKLTSAIEKEPDNISLYNTTGNVYDQLYQKAAQAGNDAKAEEYFNKALEYFQKSLQRQPDNFDAIYSVGTLYYNKAAAMTSTLNKLADDYSKEGVKKYEALKAQIFEQFDKALPYFQNAEKLQPSDQNTLIALKEIYARKDQLDISNEFKKRLETVQGGGKIEKSYFKG